MKTFCKMIAMIMAVCMVMAGCGGEVKETKPLSVNNGVETEVAQKETESTEPQITIEEAVIFDDDAVTVTVKGLEKSWTGTDIKLMVENKTDRNIAVSGLDVVVNGVTMNGYLYIDVAAGKKANGTISLYSDALQMAGIDAVATVHTCDASLVDTGSFETLGQIELSIVTSLGEDYVQSIDESGDLLYESNGVSIIAKIMEDELYGKSLILFARNDSEKDVTVQAENVSVNGFTVDAWMYDLVCAGTVRFCEMGLWESGLEENDITTIEDVTFTISLIDPQSFSTIAKSGELQVFIAE